MSFFARTANSRGEIGFNGSESKNLRLFLYSLNELRRSHNIHFLPWHRHRKDGKQALLATCAISDSSQSRAGAVDRYLPELDIVVEFAPHEANDMADIGDTCCHERGLPWILLGS